MRYTADMLSIELLGPPRLQRGGEALRLVRRKSRALVYYLAAHTEPVTRERLLSVLWPDLDRPAAQQTLRTTLHGLRKVLGPALLVDDGSLGLAPGTQVDVREFEACLGGPRPDPDRLSAGLALYRYKTRCGTMYGHSGNTFGFTQYAAASSDGSRSMTISINLCRLPGSRG